MSKHKSCEELALDMTNAEHAVPTYSVWRHLKSCQNYIVLGHCIQEATIIVQVLYRPHPHPDTRGPIVWSRPITEWVETRFERLDKPHS